MYFVTISEMYGTGGEKIAKKAAELLNYGYYGEMELLKAAESMGFVSDVKNLDEKGPTFFKQLFTEKPKIYFDRLQAVIYEVAKKGDAVFFGRGSQLLLSSFGCALHVLVTGSLEKRIQRIIEEKGVGRKMAEKMVERSDHDKKRFFRFAFDQDWLNPHLYDLVVNTDKLSIDAAVGMILDAAKSDGIKACGVDSVKSLGILSLQRKLDAAFMESGVAGSHLFLEVEDIDSVRVYGVVNSEEKKEAIEKILHGTKEIKKVTNELSIMRAAMGGM